MRKIIFALSGVLFLALLTVSCTKQKKEETSTESNTTAVQEGEKTLKKINPKDLKDNPISLFADNWFVVSSGDSTKFNEMTISWGNLGHVWEEPAVTIYIRNTRHTYSFIEKGKYFVLNGFEEKYRDKVKFIGTHSGRDTDKVKETGLTPKFTELGNPYFDEANLVIECEKIYYDDIDRAQLFEKGQKMYSSDSKETHRMYIGRIVNIWQKK